MIYYVYCLEFEDGAFYIGQTKDVGVRMSQHKVKFKKKFSYYILDEAEESNTLLLECMWIQTFKSWGFRLFNRRPFANVDINQKPNRGGGRKSIEDKVVPITVYIPKSVIDLIGKDDFRSEAVSLSGRLAAAKKYKQK